MPETIENAEELAGQLRSLMSKQPSTLIGIDGFIGAGKTRLAYCIACHTGSHVVDCDDLLVATEGVYVDRVDYGRMGNLIHRYLESRGSAIVAGICLLEVLQRLGVTPDVCVYVMRINHRGQWLDADECGENKSDEHTNRQTRVAMLPLAAQVSEYHRKFRPRGQAAYTFSRTEGPC